MAANTRCEVSRQKKESLKEGHEPCPRTPLPARPALADAEPNFSDPTHGHPRIQTSHVLRLLSPKNRTPY